MKIAQRFSAGKSWQKRGSPVRDGRSVDQPPRFLSSLAGLARTRGSQPGAKALGYFWRFSRCEASLLPACSQTEMRCWQRTLQRVDWNSRGLSDAPRCSVRCRQRTFRGLFEPWAVSGDEPPRFCRPWRDWRDPMDRNPALKRWAIFGGSGSGERTRHRVLVSAPRRNNLPSPRMRGAFASTRGRVRSPERAVAHFFSLTIFWTSASKRGSPRSGSRRGSTLMKTMLGPSFSA
jgi:hypothetical protein